MNTYMMIMSVVATIAATTMSGMEGRDPRADKPKKAEFTSINGMIMPAIAKEKQEGFVPTMIGIATAYGVHKASKRIPGFATKVMPAVVGIGAACWSNSKPGKNARERFGKWLEAGSLQGTRRWPRIF